jgi:hypothetical protein
MRHALAILALAAGLAAADAAPATPPAKPYPLDTCIITGDKLGSMGAAVSVIQDGQEVKFCCKGCIKDFNKVPAKYLAKMAEAVKAKEAAAAAAKDGAK